MDIFFEIKNKNPNILVIGDVMIDKYIYCDVNRFSKEANIPILDITDIELSLGGAANVCNNIKKLNYNVTLCSVIGKDEDGDKFKKELDKNNINYILEYDKDRVTTVKTRLYSKKQQQCRFDSEVKFYIKDETEKKLLKRISQNIFNYNSIIISDYNKGVVTDTLCQSIIKLANKNNIICIIDSKTKNTEKLLNCTLYKPNRNEFECLTKKIINNLNQTDLYSEIKKLSLSIQCKYLLLTLDKNGFILYNSNTDNYINIKTTTDIGNKQINSIIGEIIDTCGAGDTVISIMSLILLIDNFKKTPIKYLNFLEKCTDCIIHKIGTSYIDITDIIIMQKNINNVITINNIDIFSNYLKKTKKSIIFTNGCFDILHRGHIEFLKNCKNKGDIFVLGLNSDKSIKLNKGDKRPIIPLKDRIYNINALGIIDFIIIFEEKTPYNILKKLRPNILAKGDKDYTVDAIIGKEFADETMVISTENYYDTTTIINSIKKNYKL